MNIRLGCTIPACRCVRCACVPWRNLTLCNRSKTLDPVLRMTLRRLPALLTSELFLQLAPSCWTKEQDDDNNKHHAVHTCAEKGNLSNWFPHARVQENGSYSDSEEKGQ